ncbi:hypothetical protein, partial [Salmonella enterica]|uniref:hypothetical protein n=1 Tax=Salmonella enterica TaxID=28901 RepID=UPI003CEFE4C9
DGKFIYTTSPVPHGGNPVFPDEPTSQFYTADDAVGNPEVKLSPAGGSFSTETLNVTATLNEEAVSGWYQVGTGAKVNITQGHSKEFTIG